MRSVAALIIVAIAAVAIAASNRARPFVVDAHSSGRWDFNNAAAPHGFTSPPSKLFLTCPIEPENFDRRALSERSA